MRVRNVDYIKESYIEIIQFTQDEARDVYLTLDFISSNYNMEHNHRFRKSLILHAKVLKENLPISNAI